MRPYFGSSIRIYETFIFVTGYSIYNGEHIAEMESIAYLWQDGDISIRNANGYGGRIGAEDFQPILKSPTILQCRALSMCNAHFAFKEFKVLYNVKVFKLFSISQEDPNYCQQFLEQPGVKPLVVLYSSRREYVDNLLTQLSKNFSSAAVPNAFKIVFASRKQTLTEFRETNKSSEILELKKGHPVEIRNEVLVHDNYTLERFST